ncbi:glutaredoxin family protein [Halarchaeum sp. CBA1220]|uniref:glutaredoxin family protein n=1 Tax=Halarchaeum sp. CBA1220 TaxID=1853682 RepID=UPI000F3A8C8C|nr:glutaredoxin family protein [Halarchaeum sp. CBA1220]QLC33272.1 glutaredoxin family protein [Halarchaeum sp. CBA1220]
MAVDVTVYTREDCHLCEDVLATVERVGDDYDLDVAVVDVDDDPELREAYGERVPYVFVDGTPKFKYRVSEDALRDAIEHAEQ